MLSVLPTPEELVEEAAEKGWEWRTFTRGGSDAGCLLAYVGSRADPTFDPNYGYKEVRLYPEKYGMTDVEVRSLEAGFENFEFINGYTDREAYVYGMEVRELTGHPGYDWEYFDE